MGKRPASAGPAPLVGISQATVPPPNLALGDVGLAALAEARIRTMN